MTALVALEHADIDTKMKASAINQRNTIGLWSCRIRIGEEMELEHLWNFVLIISANEAANVIAENISPTGRINEFVDNE